MSKSDIYRKQTAYLLELMDARQCLLVLTMVSAMLRGRNQGDAI